MPDGLLSQEHEAALAAAKQALTEIRHSADDASARAAWGLAKIAEELQGKQLSEPCNHRRVEYHVSA